MAVSILSIHIKMAVNLKVNAENIYLRTASLYLYVDLQSRGGKKQLDLMHYSHLFTYPKETYLNIFNMSGFCMCVCISV
jgi:hypothetical protein